MFFAAEETTRAFQRLTARDVEPAVRAGNHGLALMYGRRPAALARVAGHKEVDDGCGDDEK